MPRPPRMVLPGLPHHVTQRGNRRQRIFFHDDDSPLPLAAPALLPQERDVGLGLVPHAEPRPSDPGAVPRRRARGRRWRRRIPAMRGGEPPSGRVRASVAGPLRVRGHGRGAPPRLPALRRAQSGSRGPRRPAGILALVERPRPSRPCRRRPHRAAPTKERIDDWRVFLEAALPMRTVTRSAPPNVAADCLSGANPGE